jgi:hypothetical protein
MNRRFTLGALSMLLAAQVGASPVLYAIRANGDLLRLDPTTGAGGLLGSSGVACSAAGAIVYDTGRFGSHVDNIVIGGEPTAPDQLTMLNRFSGAVSSTFQTSGRPAGSTIRAMVVPPGASTPAYVLLGGPAPASVEQLATIDLTTGAYTIIGSTGRTDLQSLAWGPPGGTLYALGTDGGGSLCTVSRVTGAAAFIGGGGFGADNQALTFMPDGRLLACGANLLSVNPATGATTLIGPTGFSDIIDLAVVTMCYANCDPDGPPPLLNIEDFVCFQARFAAGDPYANCDLSTSPPVLNVNDFICFMQAFVSADGCQ